MSVKYIKPSEAVVRDAGHGKSIANFFTKVDGGNMSVAVLSLDDESFVTRRNSRSDRAYYFLEGKGIFEFDAQNFETEIGSVLFIPKNTKYKMRGRFKSVLVNSPAFDSADEEHSE